MALIPAISVNVPADLGIECLDYVRKNNIHSIDSIPFEELEQQFGDAFQRFVHGSEALKALDDENVGFVGFDYTLPSDTGLAEQLIFFTVIFHLINISLFKPLPELKSNLPYTFYKSAVENIAALEDAGVKLYKPDEKLGYHNDVFHNGGRYYLPKYVSIVNLFMGYSEPGNFYYINKKIWTKFENLFARGIGKVFKFRPTPIVYEDTMKNLPELEKLVDIPAFWADEDGRKYAFCNGELIDSEENNEGIIEELKDSLLHNGKKIFVPLQAGRVMVFRNDLGFHARDILQGQYIFEGTTRLMLRAVSRECIYIPDA